MRRHSQGLLFSIIGRVQEGMHGVLLFGVMEGGEKGTHGVLLLRVMEGSEEGTHGVLLLRAMKGDEEDACGVLLSSVCHLVRKEAAAATVTNSMGLASPRLVDVQLGG